MRRLDSDYGIPLGAHSHGDDDHHDDEDEHHDDEDEHHDDEDEHDEDEHDDEEEHGHEEAVTIDLERTRYDIEGAITAPFGWFDGAKLRLGVTDYTHQELEGEEIGTTFQNEAWEGRFELVQTPRGRWSGAMGVQVGERDFRADGEEAFVPPTVTESLALFAYEELDLGTVSLEFGGRWDRRQVDVDAAGLRNRSFDGASGSLGLVWRPGDSALGISLAQSRKFPSAEELYSFGPHVATATFEVGNQALRPETSTGLDLFYRYRSEGFRFEVTLFGNDFDDYIYAAFTGEEEDGFEVVEYRQQGAEFYGGEVELGLELIDRGAWHVDVDLLGDVVRARLADDSFVPRLPPMSWTAGLDLKRGDFTARGEVRWTDSATSRLAVNETPTASSTVVNAFLGYRFLTDHLVYDLLLRGYQLDRRGGAPAHLVPQGPGAGPGSKPGPVAASLLLRVSARRPGWTGVGARVTLHG